MICMKQLNHNFGTLERIATALEKIAEQLEIIIKEIKKHG